MTGPEKDRAIELKGVRAGYGSAEILHGLDLVLGTGEFVGIIGPNGAGKSTLIRVMAGTLKITAGEICYSFPGRVTGQRERARQLAVLFQDQVPSLDITVWEMVELGRIPYFRPWQWRPTEHDRDRIARAMEWTGTKDLADRCFSALSGGERQRVLLAMALARDPLILLLDEPVQNLDIRYQIEIFEVLAALNRNEGTAVAAVLHDINLAAHYCSRLVLIREGRLIAAGTPRELMQEHILEELFGIRVRVHVTDSGERIVVPVGEKARLKPGG